MTTTPPPDLNKLARRYMELWQEQVQNFSEDPILAKSVAQAMTTMTTMAQSGMAAGMPGAGAATSSGEARDASTASESEPNAAGQPADQASGASATDLPPDAGTRLLAAMFGRLNAIEERLASIEAAISAGVGADKPAPRKRAPRKSTAKTGAAKSRTKSAPNSDS